MQIPALPLAATILAITAELAAADLHKMAVCVSHRKFIFWGVSYEINLNATKCACELYKNRDTGNKPWDKCKSCEFDGLTCHSANGTIGGDEFNHYCKKKCGAQGSEAG